MKKPTRKLAVRRETLRALGTLELQGAHGGDVVGTHDEANGCPTGVVAAVAPSQVPGVNTCAAG